MEHMELDPKRFSILVVDDEPRFQDSLKHLLEAQGYWVTAAGGGAEAIERLGTTSFDVVLLDLVMPEVNGRIVLEHITAKGLDTAVIVISGTTSIQDATSALLKGAQDYVSKPYDFDDLSRRVRNICEKLTLRRENRAMQMRLFESEQLYRFVIEYSPDATFVIDSEGRFTYLEGQLVRRLGYSSTDLLGHKLSELVRAEDRPEMEAHIQADEPAKNSNRALEIHLEPNPKAPSGDAPLSYAPAEIKLAHVLPDYEDHGRLDSDGLYGVIHDLRERKKVEHALQKANAFLDSILRSTINIGIAATDLDFRITYFNPAAERIFGYRAGEVIGKKVQEIHHLEDVEPERFVEAIKKVKKEGEHRYSLQQEKEGEICYVDSLVTGIYNSDEDLIGFLLIAEDVTQRMNAEQSLSRRVNLERLVTSISKNFINIHAENLDREISRSLELIGEFVGADRAYLFRFSDDGQTMDNTHEWCASGIKPYIDEQKGFPVHAYSYSMAKMLNGEILYVPVVADLPPEAKAEREEFEREGILSTIKVPIRISGATVGFLGFDSTQTLTEWSEEDRRLLRLIAEIFAMAIERKGMEEELKYLATHDAVTGLPNRSEMDQRIEDEVERALRYKNPLSIFMVDIDHFKQINDRYGHVAGDNVLHDIGELLQQTTRTADFVARYGGEEFVVILPETPLEKAQELGERLRSEIAQSPFPVDDERLRLTASIGISALSEHCRTWQDLLRQADEAMYAAKNTGRNCVVSAVRPEWH